jgi:hypothetical protein
MSISFDVMRGRLTMRQRQARLAPGSRSTPSRCIRRLVTPKAREIAGSKAFLQQSMA